MLGGIGGIGGIGFYKVGRSRAVEISLVFYTGVRDVIVHRKVAFYLILMYAGHVCVRTSTTNKLVKQDFQRN